MEVEFRTDITMEVIEDIKNILKKTKLIVDGGFRTGSICLKLCTRCRFCCFRKTDCLQFNGRPKTGVNRIFNYFPRT